MRAQSAICSFVRTVTVAAGVFAPGHLGELTWWVPFEVIDDVLVGTRSVQRRVREVPARVGLYFVLALALFPDLSYGGVWDVLVAGLRSLDGLRVAMPSDQALGQARRRVGVAPVKTLFEVLAGPLGGARTRGVRYRHWRTVAFDGCSSIKASDNDRVRAWLGYPRRWLGLPGYPTLMLVALVETGTRGLLAAVFGSGAGTGNGEISYARRLCHRLDDTMLLLGDRAYDGDEFLREVAATGARFLVRVKCTRVLPVLTVLADGSFLSRLDGLPIRVIQAQVEAIGADGRLIAADSYRLVTTLLDPRSDPAATLVQLYHERWEIESAYYALKHTLLHGRVLRSRTRAGLEQEVWAVLSVYQLLRTAMVEATDAIGADPDRASFTLALTTARNQVTTASGVLPATDPTTGRIELTGAIARAVQDNLLSSRRPRISARKVKCPTSRYPARPAADNRPLTSIDVTIVEIIITPPEPPKNPPAAPPPRRHPGLTPVLTVLASDPTRAWHARDIAHLLGETNINSIASRLSRWAAKGKLHKINRATYRLRPLNPSTVT